MACRLLALVCLAALVPLVRAGDTARVSVPERAYAVVERILERNGDPPPGHVGGRVFRNRERRLPPGRYREYDVNPRVRARDRGPERIVIDRDTGQAWYTPDHYRTFVLMERP